MKGNSNCHIFTKQGKDNYDSIFRKDELAEAGKKGSKAGAKFRAQFTLTCPDCGWVGDLNKLLCNASGKQSVCPECDNVNISEENK